MTDTGLTVPLVPFSYFRDNLLPPLHPKLSSEVDGVVRDLVQAGDIVVRWNKKGDRVLSRRWMWFPKDPSKASGKEDKVFATFATISERIAFYAKARLQAKQSIVKQTAEVLCNPTMTPSSTNRDDTATSMPDSYAVRFDRPANCVWKADVPHWDDIVMPGELRKHNRDEDFNENNVKIMWSLTQGMRETVHRRFMFGYTIENVDMRVWFCSRSDIIVSEKFNFITDHSTLVHFFLSIMFAEPVHLGYDPTISVKYLGDSPGENTYHLTVQWTDQEKQKQTSVFETTECLANISTDILMGRGTRVWRGRPVNLDSAKPTSIVIKDCWVDDDRHREGQILADILKAAVEKDRDSAVAKYVPLIEAHFLEVVCHGDVLVPVDGKEVPDHTLRVIRRGVPLPKGSQKKELRLQHIPHSPESIKPTIVRSTAKQKATRQYYGKFHYRIVFRSRVPAKPIDTVTSAQRLWDLLVQVVRGLSALHELGWIHRDISAGNILAEGTTGPAKIVDLELCKRMDAPSPPHDGRTGTPYFIPIEMDSLRYRFLRKLPRRQHPNAPPVLLSVDNPASQSGSATVRIPFAANPLHDLESLWWLAVYLTLPRRIVTGPLIDPVIQEANEKWATALFTETSSREATILEDSFFSDGIQQCQFHVVLDYIASDLDDARTSLVKAYRKAELNCRTTGIDAAATMSAHKTFYKCFKKVRDFLARGEQDFELSEISGSYLRPSTQPAKPVGGSLNPQELRSELGKRQCDASGSEDGLKKITKGVNALASPSRESGGRKRLRRDSSSALSDSNESGEAEVPIARQEMRDINNLDSDESDHDESDANEGAMVEGDSLASGEE